MRASTSGSMPRGDMIAVQQGLAAMPSGAMFRPPGQEMPLGAMRTAGSDAPSSGMPAGVMIDDVSVGMPTGAMRSASGNDDWNMDLVSAKPPCGCT
jgi:hypothetical protein